MKTILALLTAAIVLCGCNKSDRAKSVRWDYATFEEPDPNFEKMMHKEGRIMIRTDESWGYETNVAYDAEGAMQSLGQEGWDFVWQHGHKYLVKRPFATNANFTAWVEYREEKK